MKSLAIDEKIVGDQDVFRLHNYSDIIIISERIAKGLQSTSLNGFIISPASGWSDSHRF